MTTADIETFCTEINGGEAIGSTLLRQLINLSKALVEQRRPWMILRYTDTSKTITTATPGKPRSTSRSRPLQPLLYERRRAHWQEGSQNLGTENLKRCHRVVVRDADYVEHGINTSIGSYTIGSKVIGGGGEATAHPFEIGFPLHADRFQYISVRGRALEVGHAQVNSYTYKDVRDKGRRSLAVKTV